MLEVKRNEGNMTKNLSSLKPSFISFWFLWSPPHPTIRARERKKSATDRQEFILQGYASLNSQTHEKSTTVRLLRGI